jgi:LuxR family transcriptional regulator, maltose regulon positive regulatory protein
LGENCIVFRNSCYSLDLASTYDNDVWYDVTVFQDLARRSRQALSNEDTVTAKTLLTDMCQLYKGDYVQSFYSDWCAQQRDELRRGYLDARQHLARIAAAENQLDESIVHWQHMLAIDDCQEDAHHGLIRCYLRQGKRGLALRQYQRCLATLTDFGAVPGANIQHLYQRFLAKTT